MSRIHYFSNQNASLCLTVWADGIIRVLYGQNLEEALNRPSLMVTADLNTLPEPTVTTAETEREYVVATPQVRAVVDKAGLDVRFERPDGTPLSRECRKSLEAYDIYRTVGGDTEVRETVDGLRATLRDGEQAFVRTSHHGNPL